MLFSFRGVQAGPALYFSFVTNAEAFLNVPVLNPIVVKGNIRFHAFLSVDPEPSILRLSTLFYKLPKGLQRSIERFHDTLEHAITKLGFLSHYSRSVIINTIIASEQLMTMTADTKAALKNFQHSKLELFLDRYDRIWSEGWTNLEGKTTVFIQSIQNDSRVKDYSFPQNIERGRSSIKRQVITTMQTVTKFLFTTSPATDGFGLRFLGGLNILDFNVDNLELEFVYSTKAIGECNIFRKLYETVRGEKAIKLFGVIYRGFVGFIDVHPLIRLNGAVGIE